MNTKWKQSGNSFYPGEVSSQVDNLPPGVYMLSLDPRLGFYLDQKMDKFPLPSKVYGINSKFIDRCIKTWNSVQGNLGVLMNGLRGTGKTVTAEIIANRLNMPVILVANTYEDMHDFFGDIQQEVVIFFDEFEKVFPSRWDKPSEILTMMDGACKSPFRRLFLLTTNELKVDENLIQRPGRIRYLKTFGNLVPDVVTEVVTDRVHNKALVKEIVDFISELEIITLDIVCAIVDEVNIHNELPEEFKDVFNIKKVSELFAVYEMVDFDVNKMSARVDASGQQMCTERLVAENVRVYPKLDPYSYDNRDDLIHNYFMINRDNIGEIVDVLASDIIVVRLYAKNEEQEEDESKCERKIFRIETRTAYNRAFTRYSGRSTSNVQSILI
jgi:broad-specificity NMP kinase